MGYAAPLKDMLFCMRELVGLETMAQQLPAFADAGLDTAQAVLEAAAKFIESVVAPLNRQGDLHPPVFEQGKVRMTPGFKTAWQQFGQGGWQGLQHPVAYGGQALPKTIGAACSEMLNGANLAFALCPLLTDGAIEALLTAGSPAQKALYLPKMMSGEWAGTMNLTEPQAGSDLSQIRTQAQPQPDGSFKIFGTKIYITYGEHDMAANIVHMVLARRADAAPGVKGLSLFIVPKWLVDENGVPGARNDVQCLSIEHKLGIRASPTAVLQFGDQGGAIGHLVGAEGKGLESMFVMMNAARYAVGLQGIGLAEAAYQKAAAYARERVQSRPVDGSQAAPVTIVHHPDVKRMLMTMRAHTEGARALALVAAAAFDKAGHHPDAAVRAQQKALYEFLVPVVKGYATEMCAPVVSLGVQVHGGMGFIEETGVAQDLRDARILTLYEGTTAIQANDLISRKTLRDGGHVAHTLAAAIQETEALLAQSASSAARAVFGPLTAARSAFTQVVGFVLRHTADPKQAPAAFAGSVPYLMLTGQLLAGWQMGRALLAAERRLAGAAQDTAFLQAKVMTARFYAEHILVILPGLRDAIVNGAASVLAMPADAF